MTHPNHTTTTPCPNAGARCGAALQRNPPWRALHRHTVLGQRAQGLRRLGPHPGIPFFRGDGETGRRGDGETGVGRGSRPRVPSSSPLHTHRHPSTADYRQYGSPISTSSFFPHGLVVRIGASHAPGQGSIPCGEACFFFALAFFLGKKSWPGLSYKPIPNRSPSRQLPVPFSKMAPRWCCRSLSWSGNYNKGEVS